MNAQSALINMHVDMLTNILHVYIIKKKMTNGKNSI